MDKIERLRALAQSWREIADKHDARAERLYESGDASDAAWCEAAAEHRSYCADELSTLIAELGQEVGAVADGEVGRLLNNLKSERKVQRKFFNALKKGTVTDQLRIQMGNARALTDAAAGAVSSPAHTSEARDGEVAELIEATRRLTADIEFRIDDPRSQLLDRARRATTAAVGCNCPGSAKVSYLSHAPNCPAREALGKFAAMRQEGGTP